MNRNKTADDVKKEFIDVFPKGTGELFYELWTNIAHLHLNWKNYRSLFGTSPERIDLLNWAASSFFGLLNGILRNDVILAVARLTDPPRSAGKPNASLAALIEKLVPFIDESLTKELQLELNKIQSLCQPIRDIRNRILAHDDLATTLKYHPDPLLGISRAYIEEILEKIRNLFGSIEKKFRGSQTSHQYIISRNDGEDLIYALESALEHEKCRC